LVEHFKVHPFLLGGRPTYADYGLMAGLYAHLYRDPYPAQLMRQQAPEVARWVERMSGPGQYLWEHPDSTEDLIADNAVPETLKNLMRYFAEEYLPEITDHVNFANDWLDARPELETGTSGLEQLNGVLGQNEFDWRGIKLKTSVRMYNFYMLQRFQDSVAAASKSEQQAIRSLFEETATPFDTPRLMGELIEWTAKATGVSRHIIKGHIKTLSENRMIKRHGAGRAHLVFAGLARNAEAFCILATPTRQNPSKILLN